MHDVLPLGESENGVSCDELVAVCEVGDKGLSELLIEFLVEWLFPVFAVLLFWFVDSFFDEGEHCFEDDLDCFYCVVEDDNVGMFFRYLFFLFHKIGFCLFVFLWWFCFDYISSVFFLEVNIA